MEVPELVDSHLDGERVVSGMDLDGDAVFFTPTRTLLYREEGLLSDESVETFPHDVDRLELSEGRRKATFRTSDIEGTREFSVPTDRADDVLTRLLWGVLRTAGIIDDGEGIGAVYRFSELTLVVTEARIVKHVGTAVWDEEFEQFPYAALTDLAFEEGSVSTSLVLEVDGRRERVKAPSEEAPFVRQAVEGAVFDFHGVDSLEALRTKISPADEDDDDDGRSAAAGGERDEDTVYGSSVGAAGRSEADAEDDGVTRTGAHTGAGAEPHPGTRTDADPGSRADADTGGRAEAHDELAGVLDESSEATAPSDGPAETGGVAGTRDATVNTAVAERLDALEAALRRQNELLEDQQATIDQLIEELRRGR